MWDAIGGYLSDAASWGSDFLQAGAGGLIGGGLGLLGGLLTNAANEDIAHDQREFVRDMYKKRYQYTMRDLEKAGLNPILAGIGGVSTAGAPGVPSAVDALGQGISAFNATSSVASSLRLNSAQEAKAQSDAALSSQQAAAQAAKNEVLPKQLRNELTHQAFENSAIAGENALRSAQYQKLWTEIELDRIKRDSSLPPSIKQKIELYKQMFPMLPGRVAGAISSLLRSGAVGGTALQHGSLSKGLNDYLQGQRDKDYWRFYSKNPGFKMSDGSYYTPDKKRWQDYVDAQYY